MERRIPNKNIAWAREEIAKHEATIADLRTYIRIEQSKGDLPDVTQRIPLTTVINEVAKAVNPVLEAIQEGQRGAKKRAILTSLTKVEGAQTGWIVGAIELLGIRGATVENTSPQLSAYKMDGLVELSGDRWRITQRGREYLTKKN